MYVTFKVFTIKSKYTIGYVRCKSVRMFTIKGFLYIYMRIESMLGLFVEATTSDSPRLDPLGIRCGAFYSSRGLCSETFFELGSHR